VWPMAAIVGQVVKRVGVPIHRAVRIGTSWDRPMHTSFL
jgi:hypothetical protein